jgi:hypothetical protein
VPATERDSELRKAPADREGVAFGTAHHDRDVFRRYAPVEQHPDAEGDFAGLSVKSGGIEALDPHRGRAAPNEVGQVNGSAAAARPQA